jgi:hypothetical protein
MLRRRPLWGRSWRLSRDSAPWAKLKYWSWFPPERSKRHFQFDPIRGPRLGLTLWPKSTWLRPHRSLCRASSARRIYKRACPGPDSRVRESLLGAPKNSFQKDNSYLPQRTSCAAIKNLNWYLAFNQFRLVAIVRGIKKRPAEGNACNARAAEMSARMPALAKLAWMFAERAGV